MNSPFIAKPPIPMWRNQGRNVWKELGRILRSFGWFLLQAIVLFNLHPEAPQDPPAPLTELDDKQIEQCERIFDYAEATRHYLEDKARATFAFVSFLVPFLASIFIFVLGKTASKTTSHTIAIFFALASAFFLLLGFLSIVRAVTVRTRENLFLGSVIDLEQRQFRKYDKAFYARGLLYCASVNTAINDHIAQFVKGGQILTAVAVISLGGAVVPSAMAFLDVSTSPTKIEVVGSVALSSAELNAIRSAIEKLSKDMEALANSQPLQDQVQHLGERIAKVETRLQSESKPAAIRTNKSRTPNIHTSP